MNKMNLLDYFYEEPTNAEALRDMIQANNGDLKAVIASLEYLDFDLYLWCLTNVKYAPTERNAKLDHANALRDRLLDFLLLEETNPIEHGKHINNRALLAIEASTAYNDIGLYYTANQVLCLAIHPLIEWDYKCMLADALQETITRFEYKFYKGGQNDEHLHRMKMNAETAVFIMGGNHVE